MSNVHDTTYLQTIKGLLEFGRPSSDRTGTGTIKAAGLSMRFHQDHGFPLLTSKSVPLNWIERELRMFLNGITNNKFLTDVGINIWTPFANKDGELGPIYGAMWRHWPDICEDGSYREIDQIAELMDGLRDKPMSRRHIVTGWNPALLPTEGRSHAENVDAGQQALPPCHTMWQVHVFDLTIQERWAMLPAGLILSADYKTEAQEHVICDAHKIPRQGVSLELYQRSADMFLGVPFNIASYSLLLHYIAHALNMKPLEFIWVGGDCHIYNNHIDQMNEQVERMFDAPPSPTIEITGHRKDLWDYTTHDVILKDYRPMPAIKGAMAV
jgi:thymidylate synthase